MWHVSCDTDVHAPAESPALSARTFCNEAQCEAESFHRRFCVNLCLASRQQKRVSSISPDLTAAVFVSQCGGVLSRQPLRAVMRVLNLFSTLGEAAERRAEACADWLS